MIVHVPLPRRPTPQDPKAKLVLDWADVIFYIFCLAFTAVSLVLGLAYYGPTVLGLLN